MDALDDAIAANPAPATLTTKTAGRSTDYNPHIDFRPADGGSVNVIGLFRLPIEGEQTYSAVFICPIAQWPAEGDVNITTCTVAGRTYRITSIQDRRSGGAVNGKHLGLSL